jgi:hypothetical protein
MLINRGIRDSASNGWAQFNYQIDAIDEPGLVTDIYGRLISNNYQVEKDSRFFYIKWL